MHKIKIGETCFEFWRNGIYKIWGFFGLYSGAYGGSSWELTVEEHDLVYRKFMRNRV